MRLLQAASFKKTVKRLHANQKRDLDQAAGVRVHKFRMVGQLTLLAYTFDADHALVALLALGSHENFYRDLKSR